MTCTHFVGFFLAPTVSTSIINKAQNELRFFWYQVILIQVILDYRPFNVCSSPSATFLVNLTQPGLCPCARAEQRDEGERLRCRAHGAVH